MPTCSFLKKEKKKKMKKNRELTSDGILINKYHKKLRIVFYVLQITIDNH